MSAPLHHTMWGVTINRFEDGAMMSKVPPHISVIPWVPDKPNLGLEVREIIQSTKPFNILRGEPMDLGVPGHEKNGIRFYSAELVELHQRLFAHFVQRGILFSHPQWLNERYDPHFTIGKDGYNPFEQTEVLHVNEIAVIRNMPNGKPGPGTKVITYEKLNG